MRHRNADSIARWLLVAVLPLLFSSIARCDDLTDATAAAYVAVTQNVDGWPPCMGLNTTAARCFPRLDPWRTCTSHRQQLLTMYGTGKQRYEESPTCRPRPTHRPPEAFANDAKTKTPNYSPR